MPGLDPVLVETRIQALLDEAEISVVAIDSGIAGIAADAFARIGKGRGQPARLDPADCLSYAGTRAMRVPLLFKGEDFARTGVQVAGR